MFAVSRVEQFTRASSPSYYTYIYTPSPFTGDICAKGQIEHYERAIGHGTRKCVVTTESISLKAVRTNAYNDTDTGRLVPG